MDSPNVRHNTKHATIGNNSFNATNGAGGTSTDSPHGHDKHDFHVNLDLGNNGGLAAINGLTIGRPATFATS